MKIQLSGNMWMSGRFSARILAMAASSPEAFRQFMIQQGGQPRTEPTWNLPGSQITALVTGQQTQGNLLILEQTMVLNGGVPLHINHREDESFHLVDGTYLFEVAGTLKELGPGSHVFVPRGIAHRFQYVDEKPGKMLIVCQPAGLESAFDELAQLPAPIEPQKFAAVCQKYGIEVLGPPLPKR
jgi:quercetin dioxygenase-like cupin family protein